MKTNMHISPLLRTSPALEESQSLAGSRDAKNDISRSSSRLSLSAVSARRYVLADDQLQQLLPDLVPNDKMNGIHEHQGGSVSLSMRCIN